MLNAQGQSNLLSQIQQIRNMISGKNPDQMFNDLMKNNPQFREFVAQNKGKTPEQVAKDNGINPNLLR